MKLAKFVKIVKHQTSTFLGPRAVQTQGQRSAKLRPELFVQLKRDMFQIREKDLVSRPTFFFIYFQRKIFYCWKISETFSWDILHFHALFFFFGFQSTSRSFLYFFFLALFIFPLFWLIFSFKTISKNQLTRQVNELSRLAKKDLHDR